MICLCYLVTHSSADHQQNQQHQDEPQGEPQMKPPQVEPLLVEPEVEPQVKLVDIDTPPTDELFAGLLRVMNMNYGETTSS